jgi:hypothetical protein
MWTGETTFGFVTPFPKTRRDALTVLKAVSVALERAQETIYIEDWWLSPELVCLYRLPLVASLIGSFCDAPHTTTKNGGWIRY